MTARKTSLGSASIRAAMKSTHRSSLSRSLNSSGLMRQSTMSSILSPSWLPLLLAAEGSRLTRFLPLGSPPSSPSPSSCSVALPRRALLLALLVLPTLAPSASGFIPWIWFFCISSWTACWLSSVRPPAPWPLPGVTMNRARFFCRYMELARSWASPMSPNSLLRPLWPRLTLASSSLNQGGSRRPEGARSMNCIFTSLRKQSWNSPRSRLSAMSQFSFCAPTRIALSILRRPCWIMPSKIPSA
mmetsp:Transcript_11078/g.23171  ORF Transcript_11078/g.23171 Transcript_11078/m.23171 type:complete len:244 (+) Transcript_11078:1352-2083(+)